MPAATPTTNVTAISSLSRNCQALREAAMLLGGNREFWLE
jgi:hypothetical protein